MSLITKKYDYKPISRKQIDGKRKYMTPDGGAVASVDAGMMRQPKGASSASYTNLQR